MGQIAGALAAGNSVIFKPSEFTPTAAGFLAKTFAKACKCDEVFQAAVGGARLGSELIQGRPDFICFTGSTATGKKIAAAAAENLIPHILECGGKDAAIITADADLKYAVNQIAWSAFTNHGQSCISTERVIVEAPVFEKVQELMIAAVKKIKAGADYGPATTSAQHQIIVDQLTRGAASGATLLTGDLARLTNPAIEPFVVTGLDIEAELNQEESFGPVITLMPAANRSEAISLANQSRYGLAAAVFAGRGGSAIARQLQCGMVSVNSVYSFAGAAALPFGGVKSSGYGRVHGVEGIRAFANPQSEIKMRFAAPITFTKFHRPESAGAILRVALLLELAIRRRNKAKS
jgi:acyl-CoA reductase-like NAD-dependent aldehyde dehydrogenase